MHPQQEVAFGVMEADVVARDLLDDEPLDHRADVYLLAVDLSKGIVRAVDQVVQLERDVADARRDIELTRAGGGTWPLLGSGGESAGRCCRTVWKTAP